MTHKEQILNAIENEFEILKYLHAKIPQGKLDFKPAEKTRTINELLTYLTWCGLGTLKTFVEDDGGETPNYEIYKQLSEAAKDFKSEFFIEAMDKQLGSMKELFDKITDEDLVTKKVMLPFGVKQPLGEAIINTSVKHLAAYKMQLFLYLKMLGVEMNTMDCWVGEHESK